MIIAKEEFTNEDGIKMIRETYGTDDGTVTGVMEYAEPAEGTSGGTDTPEDMEPAATQLDRIEAQTAYIAMMMDGGGLSVDI